MLQTLHSFVVCRILTALAVAVGMLSTCVPAVAAQTADTAVAPKFQIVRFDVQGNTLLSTTEIEHVVAPYTGGDKDFGDIQRAREALEQTYRGHGYGTVQVVLPEQDITSGVVRLQVVEPHIGKITIEGNKYFDAANIRASLPTLKEGMLPNSQAVARNLQLLDEHPTKHTTVLLRSGDEDNEKDAVIKIQDENPLRYFATLDNSGTKETGNERLGFGFQHSNLFDRDQTLTVQYQTSPTQVNDVKIFGAGYHIPLYTFDSSVDLFAGYSDVDAGTIQNLFDVSGSGTVYGARYNFYLPKFGEYEQKVSAGLDYRAYKNEVLFNGVGLVPDITVHPASLTYSGLWHMNRAQLQFYVSLLQNVFPGGSDDTDADFKNSRADARADYRMWRYGATYELLLPKDWQLRANLVGQQTSDALVLGEQFGFGGANSVRGFNEREISNDRGYSTNLEVYTPDFGSQVKLPWEDVRLRALVFYDMGTASRNSPQPGDPPDQTGASIGIGWRLAVGKHFNLRADWAHVVDAAGQQARGDDMIDAAIALVF
jgi:hemolysin activation/secretion protein